MTWYGWLIIGVILGVAATTALVAAVGRESEERGGTLTFDSPDARAVFKHRREASTRRSGSRTWSRGGFFVVAADGWLGVRVGRVYVSLRSSAHCPLFSERHRIGCRVLSLPRGWRVVFKVARHA